MNTHPLRWLTRALTAGVLLGLAACSTTPASNPQPTSAPPKGWSSFLSQYQWQLTTATDSNGRALDALQTEPGRSVETRFSADPADARLSITGGCNNMSGRYQVSESGTLAVSQVVSTRRACVGALMQVDAALSGLLAQAIQLRSEDATGATSPPSPPLTMRIADGSTLVWVGKLTPEARYGAPTTIFYEVGPERLTCPHPLMPNARCLQVREIKYDAQGLAIGAPSEWQNLYQEIEGYTHTVGQRQVLRIKKYQRPQPLPADASSIVLVLDMVVRTETTTK